VADAAKAVENIATAPSAAYVAKLAKQDTIAALLTLYYLRIIITRPKS
jgi:hypothetical protein